MTQAIKNWPPKPSSVSCLQTSSIFESNQYFSVHPDHNQSQDMMHLAKQFGLPHTPKFLKQVHGNRVIEYTTTPQNNFTHEADACFTKEPGIVCAVMTADCLPVLLTDAKGSFVAAVHCGWRSLFANILVQALAKINSPNQILAWFGPCIQQQQYEVDAAFRSNYLSVHPECEPAFSPSMNGKSLADLPHLATLQLNKQGVSTIHQSRECTYLNDHYYSWRQNQTPNRMASMIWLKENC